MLLIAQHRAQVQQGGSAGSCFLRNVLETPLNLRKQQSAWRLDGWRPAGRRGGRGGHRNMRASSPSSSVSTADSDSTRVFSPRMGYGTARLERDTTTCRALGEVRVLFDLHTPPPPPRPTERPAQQQVTHPARFC